MIIDAGMNDIGRKIAEQRAEIARLQSDRLREHNALQVIRNLLDIDNSIPVEDAVNRLLAERNELRAALGECRKMVGHPDNIAFIDKALANEGKK